MFYSYNHKSNSCLNRGTAALAVGSGPLLHLFSQLHLLSIVALPQGIMGTLEEQENLTVL